MAPGTALAPGHGDSVLCCAVLGEQRLLASGAEDGTLCFTDFATLKPVGRLVAPDGDAVPALCSHPAEPHTLFAAAGAAVLQLDLRRGLGGEALCRSFHVNADEVNGLAVGTANGGWLAAGDDAGEVAVISLQQPGGAAAAGDAAAAAAGTAAAGAPAGRPHYKTLRRGHSNICACVAFRPHRPWELLSGGLDSTVVRWDFNRLRPLHSWSLSGEATASGGQLFNPPMVHSLAVPQSEERGCCRLMAVGRGDGCVSLYDADYRPAAGSSSGGGGGGGKKGGSKARQRGGGGSGGGGAQRGQGAAAAGAAAAPGRLALLGQEQGGHTAAVNCVSFYAGPGSTGGELLLSAGNDCRLLLWNWRAAAAAGQEGAEAAAEAAAAAGGAYEGPSSADSGSSSSQQGGEKGGAAAVAGAGATETAGGTLPLVAAEHRQARKINWACSADLPGCPYDVFLADTGRRLTALTLARA
ncbi:WD repeat-containing 53 [Micractinium conductrix]|uniref:WD repeat-containing 53 n=1 Tax=Micractinium conductrix TaxID=554055 RepID=A0A2P6VLU3_9CHLO|nr:WD repeat-containing 53 [Micractinium conductrix]|eukprot:PSC75076.1 WD repeat-containing 53 [Micractinium conductrix]